MSKVSADISMSLDGFIAGPNDSLALPLGENGDLLHQWLYDLASWRERHGLEGGKQDVDADLLAEGWNTLGAVVMGRRMFDLAEEAWGEEPPFHMPVFVVTHRARETAVKQGGTTFTFVTDGIESALHQARAAAGDKDVGIAGGAQMIQQYLRAGLLDEIQIHLVPILLGGGRRLFEDLGTAQIELERTRAIETPGITHLLFRVIK